MEKKGFIQKSGKKAVAGVLTFIMVIAAVTGQAVTICAADMGQPRL